MLLGWLCASGATGQAAAAPPSEPSSEPSSDALQACRDRIEAQGITRISVMCLYEVSRAEGRWDEVHAELRREAQAPGASAMWKLPLAAMVADHGDMHEAIDLLGEALVELPEPTPATEAYIRVNRGMYLRTLDRYPEAEHDLRRVVQLGRSSGNTDIELAGQLELGAVLQRRGGDLSEIREIYDDVVPRALAGDSYLLGNKALVARASLLRYLGRVRAAAADYEQMRARAQAQGDAYDVAYASTALLEMELGYLDLRDGGEVPATLRARLDQAWAAVRAAEQQHSIAYLTCVEGDLLAGAGHREQAAAQYARCAQLYEAMGVNRGLLLAQGRQAFSLAYSGELSEADALSRHADERARALGITEISQITGFVRIVVAVLRGDMPAALEGARRHFEEFELFRELQGDEEDRSWGFEAMASSHYFVSGVLLRDHADSPAMLDEAFVAIERMRARNLLDGLRRSDAMRPDPDDPNEQRWQSVVTEIAALQKTLLQPSLEPDERERELSRLEQLEARERRLRGLLAEGEGELGSLLVPDFPRLAEVQAALDEDTAILSYQLADDVDILGAPGGGSWLWVITRDAVQVQPLPERRVLERQLDFVTGLFAGRDGRQADAAARLHGELMAAALASLSSSVERLVIVPDGDLWSLPFCALAPAPGAPPLISDYSITMVPSVTSWMQWGDRPDTISAGLLALAQPQVSVGAGPAQFRQGTLASGLDLGALPRAAEEVEAITRIWEAGPSQAEVGETASEQFVKQSDLSDYGLLHFATHAVMDPRYPDRSAVVLAAGSEHEDGLLQAREIVRLPLHGKVVVLSACSGAAGAFVRGEGVMSLARAFLQGGAQAVVASRWPLADADAMALFERLYLHLDEGASLADALASAQRDLMDAGAPAAAWAGVVVLGRGDIVLVSRPVWWRWRRPGLALGALLALALGAWLGWRGRHRTRASAS